MTHEGISSVAGNGSRMPELKLQSGGRASEKGRVVVSVSRHTQGFVDRARELLEVEGYTVTPLDIADTDAERVRETIDIASAAGVLDVTLTGLANELIGRAPTPGLMLLNIAGQAGVPLVLVPGGLDMLTFASRALIPPQWGRRKFVEVAPDHIVMRTDTSDNARLGRLLAEKVNQAAGPVAVALPLRGLSDLGAPGEPFSSADITMALFGNLTTHLRRDIRLVDSNVAINDPGFAQLCVEVLQSLMRG